MTDYMKGEPVWVVHDGTVYGCLFDRDTHWLDGNIPLVMTSLGVVHVTSVYKSSTDAQVSLREGTE